MWTWSPEESRFGDLVWVVRAQGQVPARSNASIAGAGGGRGVCRADGEEWPEVGKGACGTGHWSGVL